MSITAATVQEFSRAQVWAYITDNGLPVKKLAATEAARQALIDFLGQETESETLPESGINTEDNDSELSYTEETSGLENTAPTTTENNMTTPTRIALADINIGTELFQFRRSELNQDHVNWLAANWDESALDPLDLWRDESGKLWLVGGHHRYAAASLKQLVDIISRVHTGSLEQARTIAAVSNASRLEYLPIEYCNCMVFLVGQGLTVDQAANKLAVKPNFAARYYALRLLKGTGWEQWLNTDLLSSAYVVALHAEKSPFNPGELDSLLKIVVDREMNLAQVKKLLSDLKTVKGKVTKGSQSTLFDMSAFETDRVVEAVKVRENDNKCRMYAWYTYELVQNNPDIPDDIKLPLLKELRRLNSHLIGADEPETVPTRTSKKLRVDFPVAA
jgi:hypothetical protein